MRGGPLPRWSRRAVYFLRRGGLVASALALGGGLTLGGGLVVATPVIAAAAGSCQAAGSTGMTAKVIAASGQWITGTIDATGCDIGVYAGPGVTNLTIIGATISDAHDHGILLQQVTNSLVTLSNVSNNGLTGSHAGENPGQLSEDKGIELLGTTNVTVSYNTVKGNQADGGIGISDDGPIISGALVGGSVHTASGNTISWNDIENNPTGCGIVISSYNPGGGVANNLVMGNISKGNSVGIVVAADVPNTSAMNNIVVDNTSTDNLGPGVVIHSNTPGDVVDGTRVLWNTISGNPGFGPQSWGIAILGEVEPPTNSFIAANHISKEDVGIFQMNTQNTTIVDAGFNKATTPEASK